MIIDILVQKCMVTANGSVMFDTIGGKQSIQLNTDRIAIIVDFNFSTFNNHELIIMANNKGYIVVKGVV